MEIGDDPILHRADRDDAFGRAPQHPLGLEPDPQDVAIGIDGSHGWLVEDDALTLHEDQGVGGTEVDGKLAGGAPGLSLGQLPATG
jgi:hypothetical protein